MTTKATDFKLSTSENEWSEFEENVTNIADEQYDFDLKFSPVQNLNSKVEELPSNTGDKDEVDEEDDDDEDVFFGPVGHKERCLKAALEQNKVESGSPLNGRQVVELFKEATSIAVQIEQNQKGNKYTPTIRTTNNTRRSLPISTNTSQLSQTNNVLKRKSDQLSAEIVSNQLLSSTVEMEKTNANTFGKVTNSSVSSSRRVSKLPKFATENVKKNAFDSIVQADVTTTMSDTVSESKSNTPNTDSLAAEKTIKIPTIKNNQKSIPIAATKSQFSKLPRMAGRATNLKLKYSKIPTNSCTGRAPLKAFNGAAKTQIPPVNKHNIIKAADSSSSTATTDSVSNANNHVNAYPTNEVADKTTIHVETNNINKTDMDNEKKPEVSVDVLLDFSSKNCESNVNSETNSINKTDMDNEKKPEVSVDVLLDFSSKNCESNVNSSEASCANLIDFEADIPPPQTQLDNTKGKSKEESIEKENVAVDLLISI
ncbi:uncharacterized protein TRIADDRAFT_55442 [Trichoplax adhaerens]|uniref:G2 and S phase-expressed protein 1 N-terminal domain-containing protein n=1 Tax=Trichoplax adhaerens TaxID=10228 RepID=B3RUW9_TRIAD|nr:predicted protein [Trichoplax adhaerens]EDV25391.1 predicted protein [Trichoplax adhaerens]|eukprot:XP_002111424.1 predicted protein [Trichoplax adhaerens]